MKDKISKVQTYDELLDIIRQWKSFDDEYVYDFGGIVHIIAACIDNIKKYSTEGDLEDIGEFFTEEQIDYLKDIVKKL